METNMTKDEISKGERWGAGEADKITTKIRTLNAKYDQKEDNLAKKVPEYKEWADQRSKEDQQLDELRAREDKEYQRRVQLRADEDQQRFKEAQEKRREVLMQRFPDAYEKLAKQRYEGEQKLFSDSYEVEDSRSLLQSFAASTSGGGHSGGGGSGGGGYYDSGRDGHMSRDFLDQGNSRGGGGDRGDGGGGGNSCFNCADQGHFSCQCPKHCMVDDKQKESSGPRPDE